MDFSRKDFVICDSLQFLLSIYSEFTLMREAARGRIAVCAKLARAEFLGQSVFSSQCRGLNLNDRLDPSFAPRDWISAANSARDERRMTDNFCFSSLLSRTFDSLPPSYQVIHHASFMRPSDLFPARKSGTSRKRL